MNWYLAEMLVRERQNERCRETEEARLAAMARDHEAAATRRTGRRVAVQAGRLSMVLMVRWRTGREPARRAAGPACRRAAGQGSGRL